MGSSFASKPKNADEPIKSASMLLSSPPAVSKANTMEEPEKDARIKSAVNKEKILLKSFFFYHPVFISYI
ncbi:MAG: hypothetical protein U0M42_04390 [Acutalibacteraceae bacterium]|nr:hypothetical protein [Acutalibacteraceae bacterium]